MKHLALIMLSAFCVSSLHGVKATNDLDPKLLRVFEQIQSESEKLELEGQEFEIDLTVKVASDRFLIFSDAYLQVDKETKYQIGKWLFTPEQTTTLEVKRGSVCRVKFKIEKVMTEAPYTDMPHFTARILSITPLPAKVDPIGGREIIELDQGKVYILTSGEWKYQIEITISEDGYAIGQLSNDGSGFPPFTAISEKGIIRTTRTKKEGIKEISIADEDGDGLPERRMTLEIEEGETKKITLEELTIRSKITNERIIDEYKAE